MMNRLGNYRGIGSPAPGMWGWWMATEAYVEDVGIPATRITTDGADIGSLKDMSGNGRNAYSPSSLIAPTYRVNILNGLPIWRHSGTLALISTAGHIITNGIYSVYLVFRALTWGNNIAILSLDDDTGNILIRTPNSGGSSGDWAIRNNSSGGSSASVNYPVNEFHMMAGTCGSSVTLYNQKDAAAPVTGAGSVSGSVGAGATRIQMGRLGDSGNPLHGEIAEMVLYNAYHGNPNTAPESLQTRRYLNRKYNLGLTI